MAPRSVSDTWDCTATPAKFLGRYFRARASDIWEGKYPRPDGATQDTACRCYLRGPDGVSGLSPSGTWGNEKYNRMTDTRYPIPDTRYPIPDTRYPIPDTRR